ncbi:aminoglycoside phosphotransferase [Janibacter sp. UYMM211]|uniref:maltokinase N-terminal cap-like domain-containing protein n=1 Tax=Janibacter sp. UYMM211 TaxID=3156342 RepID=UPI003395B919
MATVHDVTLTPGKDDLVLAWVGAQRWYQAKGRTPRLRRLDSWRLDDPAGEVGIETLVYEDLSGADGGPGVTYQVPLTYRGAPLPGADDALVGELDHPVLGHRWVYDAPHDPVYVSQLLALVRGRAQAQEGSVSDTPRPDVAGAPHPAWTSDPEVVTSSVLRGEQSNTSVVVETGAEPVIVKIFRTLSPGDNPDVTLQGALGAANCPYVPATVGHVAGAWRDADGQTHLGHLAVAQEYLRGSRDAWRVALERASSGTPFAEEARALGVVTADIHHTLARVLPTRPADDDLVAAQVSGMRRRASLALGEVPALAEHEPAFRDVFTRARAARWPAMQRIHGDYHLGQVLHVPDRGWVVIDFEGEPLRPLAERNALDAPLRDVAGMLRSIDYAGASSGLPDAEAAAWVAETSRAFLEGYAEAGHDARDDAAVLTALTLDKALYEVVYEARNRPTWLAIPVRAVTRLLQEDV